MSLYLSPMFYGIQDYIVPDSTPFAVRVYYPTDDDTVLGSPLLKGPHPLVIFAHGQRASFTVPAMCPPEYTRDHQRWGVVLGGIARSGYVVASPNVQGLDPTATAGRISATIGWMRSQWEGRKTILKPPVADPGIHSGPLSEHPEAEIVQSKAGAPYVAAAAPFVLPPVQLGSPTALALVGHSWGTRGICAFAAANSGVAALVTIAGTFDDNESITNIRQAHVPTLMMCGTADSQNFSPMLGLWSSLSTPKYQAAFQGVDHWGWFGRFGAIRRCDGTPPPWRDTGHIAGELIAGFFARHVANVAYLPPDLVRIPILRPNGMPWYEQGSAIQMRWDAPGQNFDTLPTTGDGILGPWTESPPF